MTPLAQAIVKTGIIDETKYHLMVLEVGCQYLEKYCPNDEYAQKILSYSTAFWKWWVNEWEIMNCEIKIAYIKAGYNLKDKHKEALRCLKNLFYNMHSLDCFEYYPNRVVWNIARKEWDKNYNQIIEQ